MGDVKHKEDSDTIYLFYVLITLVILYLAVNTEILDLNCIFCSCCCSAFSWNAAPSPTAGGCSQVYGICTAARQLHSTCSSWSLTRVSLTFVMKLVFGLSALPKEMSDPAVCCRNDHKLQILLSSPPLPPITVLFWMCCPFHSAKEALKMYPVLHSFV